MLDSSFQQDLTENLANGYTKNFAHISSGHKLMPEQAAAGLWTTALDTAKFGLHIQNILRGRDGLILKEIVKKMVTPQHNELLKLKGTL